MNSSSVFLGESFKVCRKGVHYTDDEITSNYTYTTSTVQGNTVYPTSKEYVFKTNRHVPKTGVMLVGWGGNNGTTFTAGILANKHNLTWCTKEGELKPNYFGSITQSSTVRLGLNVDGRSVYTPLNNLLPMVNPNDFVIGGWDISSLNLAEAMQRSKVIDYNLQQQLIPYLSSIIPLPSIYYEDFIAANQNDRADNIIHGTKQEQLDKIRNDIKEFRLKNGLEKVIVVWTANTERYSVITGGINDTADNILASIQRGESEVSPSTIFAVASILENCAFINGSPQNTFVPGVVELAERMKVMIAGDDFKSGQTKIKSALVDLLVSAGIKPVSIVSYNHLGNNDGKNLSAPEQFRSKEISKSGVVEDMVDSNRILYSEGERPDHCVVIKYVPYVGDSKRAMDEYTSEIFLNGKNTIVIHNTCEDSLLASPLIIDLVVLAELADRIQVSGVSPLSFPFEKLHPVLSILSYLLKAPIVPPDAPVINALGQQRNCLVNFLLACVGLPPDDNMLLEHKLPSEIREVEKKRKAGSFFIPNGDQCQGQGQVEDHSVKVTDDQNHGGVSTTMNGNGIHNNELNGGSHNGSMEGANGHIIKKNKA
eukprot:gene2136-4167_t